MGKLIQRRQALLSEPQILRGRYAVPVYPGTNRVDGDGALLSYTANARSFDDGSMCPHGRTVHYAQSERKCQLHSRNDYPFGMDKAAIAQRLKAARIAAGYETVEEAALALHVSKNSYAQHENATRGFKLDTAQLYARKFKTTPEWLLYGRAEKSEPLSEDVLAALIEDAVQEIPAGTTIEAWPRLVAGVLHTQLEQIRSGSEPVDLNRARAVRERAFPTRAPTTRDVREG